MPSVRSFLGRSLSLGAWLLLAFAFLILRCPAEDQIKKKDGTLIVGTIIGVSNGQVSVNKAATNGGVVKLSYYISDIQSVSMTPPPEVDKAKGAAPADVIAALEPLVKQFAGLPSDWVTDAMAQLGEAYDAAGKPDQASAVYTQINQLYPGSSYQYLAAAGTAKQLLAQGKIPDALALLQPIVDKANANLAPSPGEARLYANVFLVYGQALEAQKKLPAALEAYLTVKTMFYQNPALADAADKAVKALRAQNPGVVVD
jgi:tetratricopeptide (TPR) repeat protein